MTARFQVRPEQRRPPEKGLGTPRHWWFLVALILGGALLILAFKGVAWNALLTTARHGQPRYLALAFATLSLSHSMRAVRWGVLLSAERRLSPLITFWGTEAGYLGNYCLPARAGEVIRSVLIGHVAGLSVAYVLATALTERILDAIVLVCISLGAVTTLATLPGWVLAAVRLTAIVACGGLVALLAAPRLLPTCRSALSRLPLPERIIERLLALVGEFALGTRAFQHAGRALQFLGLTALIWPLDAVVTLEVARAFHLGMTLPEALLLLAALGLASAAPSTPGYLGIYQYVAVTVLAPFGMRRSSALVFILAYQAVTYAVVIIWGTIGLWRLSSQSPSIPTTAGADPQS